MALEVTNIERKFEFENADGEKVIMPDPGTHMSTDEVMNFYANTYPELTTATVSGPEMKEDKAVYTFKTTVGTKG